MKLRHIALIAVLVLVACTPTLAGTFSDDFSSGASSLWGNECGSWIASSGVYYAQSPNNSPATYTSLPFNMTDFTIDTDINGVSDGGIWLRSSYNSGDINGVVLVTGGYGRSFTGLYWHVIQNCSCSSVINPVAGLFNQGDDVHVRVVVSGNQYSAYIGDSTTPVTTLYTDLFASGNVGLYDFSGQKFDNVRVEGQGVVPEPSSYLALFSGLASLGGFAIRRRRA